MTATIAGALMGTIGVRAASMLHGRWPNLKLTNKNYYSLKANQEFMSVSQYKQFVKCEAAAMAQIRGEWEIPKTTALLVGSYIDSWFEGTLEDFCQNTPEIYRRDGALRSDFVQAEQIIEFLKKDRLFMRYMSGRKQIIKSGELFGAPWKIKMDSYHRDKIVDLKIMANMSPIAGEPFVTHWGYDLQMAIYSAIEGHDLPTYLAVATKEDPPDKELISVPKWRRVELLKDVERHMPRILAVKNGKVPPNRCGRCPYCRATKILEEPIDFDLAGLSFAEREAVQGGFLP